MFELKLLNFYSGWLEIKVSKANNSSILIASYCYDTPLELLKGINKLFNVDEKIVKVFFEAEIKAYLLVIEKKNEKIILDILLDEKEDFLSINKDINLNFEKYLETRKYQKIFSEVILFQDLVKQVINLFSIILQDYHYKEIWGLSFPIEEYEKLTTNYSNK